MELSKAVASAAVVLAVMLAAGYAVGHQEPVPEVAKAQTTRS
ncbi:MAG: hypothetical protein ACREXU_05900 [Gammaproteobacteria bacterium]